MIRDLQSGLLKKDAHRQHPLCHYKNRISVRLVNFVSAAYIVSSVAGRGSFAFSMSTTSVVGSAPRRRKSIVEKDSTRRFTQAVLKRSRWDLPPQDYDVRARRRRPSWRRNDGNLPFLQFIELDSCKRAVEAVAEAPDELFKRRDACRVPHGRPCTLRLIRR